MGIWEVGRGESVKGFGVGEIGMGSRSREVFRVRRIGGEAGFRRF